MRENNEIIFYFSNVILFFLFLIEGKNFSSSAYADVSSYSSCFIIHSRFSQELIYKFLQENFQEIYWEHFQDFFNHLDMRFLKISFRIVVVFYKWITHAVLSNIF